MQKKNIINNFKCFYFIDKAVYLYKRESNRVKSIKQSAKQ